MLNRETESLVKQIIQESKKEIVKLASELISIRSENPNDPQNVIIEFIKNYLKNADISSEITGANPKFPCLVAEIGNNAGPKIILNAHVDVVPAGELDRWDYDPFCGTVKDNMILGRGSSDMKGGAAIFIHLMKTLKRFEKAINGCVVLHIVTDEESGGQYGSGWLCDNGYADGADACMISEPTSINCIEVGQKGRIELTLKASGKSAHGSLGGYKGINAIQKMSTALDRITRLSEIKGNYECGQEDTIKNSKSIAENIIGIKGSGELIDHLSLNIGLINGGVRSNIVPEYCEAVIDIRTPIGITKNEIKCAIDRILRDAGDDIGCLIDWQSDANYTDETSLLVQVIKKNAESVCDKKIMPFYQWASSDARYYRYLGIPTIMYGPGNMEGIHADNESVNINDIMSTELVYALSLFEMLEIR